MQTLFQNWTGVGHQNVDYALKAVSKYTSLVHFPLKEPWSLVAVLGGVGDPRRLTSIADENGSPSRLNPNSADYASLQGAVRAFCLLLI